LYLLILLQVKKFKNRKKKLKFFNTELHDIFKVAGERFPFRAQPWVFYRTSAGREQNAEDRQRDSCREPLFLHCTTHKITVARIFTCLGNSITKTSILHPGFQFTKEPEETENTIWNVLGATTIKPYGQQLFEGFNTSWGKRTPRVWVSTLRSWRNGKFCTFAFLFESCVKDVIGGVIFLVGIEN